VAERLRAPRKSCRPTWTRPHGWAARADRRETRLVVGGLVDGTLAAALRATVD